MLSENRKNHAKRMLSDFCMNPRGELWKKDENNFGNKLMKKMGWKNGDGLGKKGSGITEPIRLVQTHDNEGLGYKKQTSDYSWNWLAHQDDYHCLLSKLQEQHSVISDESSVSFRASSSGVQQSFDLEKKSKGSRKRVHYKRNIEGKNLSNRSQSDWKCILGIKRKRKALEDENLDTHQEAGVGSEVLHTSTISSQEYFMFKRQKREETRENNEAVGDLSQQVVAEDNLVEQQTSEHVHQKKRKKKKKRGKKKFQPEQKTSLEESEAGCSDSAIGSEISGSCDGEQIISPEGLPDSSEEVRNGCGSGTEPEKQNGVVCEEKGQSESDDPLARNQDAHVEKENRCQAEDSLLILRKFKKRKKKKKRVKLEPVSDMTNLDWKKKRQEKGGKPFCSNIDNVLEKPGCCCETAPKRGGILKIGLGDCSKRQKKSVRFLHKPDIGYVPACDSIRGGAWIWKRKNLLSSL